MITEFSVNLLVSVDINMVKWPLETVLRVLETASDGPKDDMSHLVAMIDLALSKIDYINLTQVEISANTPYEDARRKKETERAERLLRAIFEEDE
jgi:hypothetical protein